MSVKKIFITLILCLFFVNAFAVTPRSTGKYKNWESFTAETDKGKFASLKQSQQKEHQLL